ncbi:hypothetical protein RRG08_047622 [Elysia crispata]|uniref:Uncharacterized protein n=1 Tax=Elysia crispata TaxID=231223 RepID=A0AAE1BDV2_9GAST|nr:hypothetical protein RRG08_047622 [Elysia crispata]
MLLDTSTHSFLMCQPVLFSQTLLQLISHPNFADESHSLISYKSMPYSGFLSLTLTNMVLITASAREKSSLHV